VISEQNASIIVKISQQVAKLWQKVKWLDFFWDTVYINEARRIMSAAKCRPMVLVPRNMGMCGRFTGEGQSNDSAVVCRGRSTNSHTAVKLTYSMYHVT